MADARVSDPAVTFRFRVICPKLVAPAGFSKVSGLRDESEVIEYREGSDQNLAKRKYPGMREFPALVFSKGATRDASSLLTWRKLVLSGPGAAYRAPVFIGVNDALGAVVRSYSVDSAWPSSLEIADLDAMSSEVAIESMELQHEGTILGGGSVFA